MNVASEDAMTSFARSLTDNANTLASLIPAVRDGGIEAVSYTHLTLPTTSRV